MPVETPQALLKATSPTTWFTAIRTPRQQLPNGWITHWHTPEDAAGAWANFAPDEGLLLVWSEPSAGPRLECPLEASTLLMNEGQRARLVITLAPGVDAASCVDWIGLAEGDAERAGPVIARLASGGDFQGRTLEREVELPPLNDAKACLLVIQFLGAAGRAELAAVELETLPAAEDDLPTSTGAVPTRRQRALVVSWSLGHNAAGRAFLLANLLAATHDVELLGPLFPAYGSKLWGPLQQVDIPVRTFPGGAMAELLRRTLEEVEKTEPRPDVVIVSKPRMPGMLLGLLMKHRFGCPLILDIDDHELSLSKVQRKPIALGDMPWDAKSLDVAHGQVWTRLCESLVPLADAVTVSNIALRERFGGTIIRHARDESLFAAVPSYREAERRRFGYEPQDRVVLFLGTPRAHKGIVVLAQALAELDDKRLALCIIGATGDDEEVVELCRAHAARVDVFPPQPWRDLPRLMSLADAVCLLQDPHAPIARYQIPAKLSDALAAGVPVAVSAVAPFADLPQSVVTHLHSDADLKAFLRAIAEDRAPGSAEARHAYYLKEFSYATNRARLARVIAGAQAAGACWPEPASALLGEMSRHFAVALPKGAPTWGAPTW